MNKESQDKKYWNWSRGNNPSSISFRFSHEHFDKVKFGPAKSLQKTGPEAAVPLLFHSVQYFL